MALPLSVLYLVLPGFPESLFELADKKMGENGKKNRWTYRPTDNRRAKANKNERKIELKKKPVRPNKNSVMIDKTSADP